jgi:signal peptidase II
MNLCKQKALGYYCEVKWLRYVEGGEGKDSYGWSINLKKYFWDYFYLISVAAVIVAFDQWTKGFVRTTIPLGSSWSPWPWLMPFARLVHWQNTGAAFGMFQGMGLVFTILAFIVAIGIIYYFRQVPRNEWALRLAMAMMLGGAVGNLIDRLTQGTVTDFISVGTFAVFNVADASISVGTVILVLAVWIGERKQKKRAENSLANPAPEETDSKTEMEWLPDTKDKGDKPEEPTGQISLSPELDEHANNQPGGENHEWERKD